MRGLVARGEVERGLEARGEVERGLAARGEVERGLAARGEVERGLAARGEVERGLAARGEVLTTSELEFNVVLDASRPCLLPRVVRRADSLFRVVSFLSERRDILSL